MYNNEQFKEKIQEEKDYYQQKINELNQKIRVFEANSFEMKLQRVIAISMFPVLICTVSLLVIAMNGGNIPVKLIQPLTIGVPLLIGVVGDKLLSKKYKLKKRLAAISNSKNQSDRIEEVVRYTFERERAKTCKTILEMLQEKLKVQENALKVLLNDHNITPKKDGRTIEEINANITRMQDELTNKKEELLQVIKKIVLKNKFSKFQSNFDKFDNIAKISMVGGFFTFCFSHIPFIAVNSNLGNTIQFTILELFAPFIIGSLICGIYASKNQKDNLNVYNKLNYELGENAIDNKFDVLSDEVCKLIMNLEMEKVIREKKYVDDIDENMNEKINTNQRTIDNTENIAELHQEGSIDYSGDFLQEKGIVLKKVLK